MIVDIKDEGISHATENIIVCEYLNHMYDKYLTNVVNKLSVNFANRIIDCSPVQIEQQRDILTMCMQNQFRCDIADGVVSTPSVGRYWHTYSETNVYKIFGRFIPLELFDVNVHSVYVLLTSLMGYKPNDSKILLDRLFEIIGRKYHEPVAIPVGFLGAKNNKLQTLATDWVDTTRKQIDELSSKHGVKVVLYLCDKNDDIWSDYEEPGTF